MKFFLWYFLGGGWERVVFVFSEVFSLKGVIGSICKKEKSSFAVIKKVIRHVFFRMILTIKVTITEKLCKKEYVMLLGDCKCSTKINFFPYYFFSFLFHKQSELFHLRLVVFFQVCKISSIFLLILTYIDSTCCHL